MGKAWIIASGKGGVGKSTITSALATALCRMKQTVCIVDADIGLRDQDVILGMENRVVYDLTDVCAHRCTLPQALIQHTTEEKLYLLPAAQFARVKDVDPKDLRKIVRQLKNRFQHVLIDCPAGIERGLRGVLHTECDDCLLICTPDDVCIRDVERTGSLIAEKKALRPQLIVNRLNAELIAAGEMYTAQVVAQTLDLPLLGEVPEDPVIYRALLKHIPLMDCRCEGAEALTRIARRMTGENVPLPGYGTKKPSLFRRMFGRKIQEVQTVDR